jgi:adenosylmethionine---8-amino-7-oxononanoate aminotransferase
LELIDRDLAHIWHPCMQMKEFETMPLVPIKSAKGVWLEDFDGNRYIDAISSWWVNIFGHSNDYINAKMSQQLANFSHIMTANFTHEPIVRLSERLCALSGLDKAFFADNGSSAIEAALKMAFQYHKNIDRPRKKFICFENSYHGETIGALSVGDVGLYRSKFAELLFDTTIAPVPKDQSEDAAAIALGALRAIMEREGEDTAAVILEPLAQCAGGMKMHSPSFVTGVKQLCEEYGALLILDEIAVGFGRTGTMFAHERAGVRPDIMCLSKGITGGYMPLSVVLTTDKIYDAFYDDYESGKAFLHSHSYSGNALACSCANAVLDIFENEPILADLRRKSEKISEPLAPLADLPKVLDVRNTGMIFAIEMDTTERIAPRVFEAGLKLGVFLRPLGNVIYVMPPLVINDEEIEMMCEAVCAVVRSI